MESKNLFGLTIPEQSTASEQDIFQNEKNLGGWLKRLPMANIGETSRLIFQTLRTFNHTKVPYKKRFTSAEAFRSVLTYIDSSLSKHFIHTGFPLSEKAQSVSTFDLQLHRSLATAYKAVVIDIILEESVKQNSKLFATAIHRAIYYLGHEILLTALNYVDIPKHVWLELHTLYRMACQNQVVDMSIEDQLEAYPESTDIKQAYSRCILFYLTSPHKTRQHDNIQVFECLLPWSKYVSLNPIDDSNQDSGIMIRQRSDSPPQHGCQIRSEIRDFILCLDTTDLIGVISKQFDAQSEHLLWGIDTLDITLIRQMIRHWTKEQKRSFMRTNLKLELHVIVGFKSIYDFLMRKSQPHDEQTDPRDEMAIGEGSEQFTFSGFKTDSLEYHPVNFEAFGPLSKDPEEHLPFIPDWPEPKVENEKDVRLPLRTVNESAGGYCLDWNGQNAPKLMVGELIGVQTNLDDVRLGLGVIRWIRNQHSGHMQVGMQMIAPDASAVGVRLAERKFLAARKGLLLPEIKAAGLYASLISEPGLYQVGQQLLVDVGDETKEIKLSQLIEATKAYAQFRYLEEPKEKKKSDEFAHLWRSI